MYMYINKQTIISHSYFHSTMTEHKVNDKRRYRFYRQFNVEFEYM